MMNTNQKAIIQRAINQQAINQQAINQRVIVQKVLNQRAIKQQALNRFVLNQQNIIAKPDDLINCVRINNVETIIHEPVDLPENVLEIVCKQIN